MSKVTNVLERNLSDSTSIVYYNSSSVDSTFGGGLIKYICENITDVSEQCECYDIKDFNIDDLYSLSYSYVDVPLKNTSYSYSFNNETGSYSYCYSVKVPTYINVSFVGCVPQSNIADLASIYGDTCLYVLSDKENLNSLKSVSNKVSIEYTQNDSCTLNLYKIAFGEFEDSIPTVIKCISNYELKEFDKDYEEGLRFNYGFKHNYTTFNEFYSNILENIILEEEDKNVSEESVNNTIVKYIDDGENIINEDIDSIVRNVDIPLNDLWKVGGKDAVCIFTNGPISKDILNKIDTERLVVFYRNKNNNWNLELFAKEFSVEELTELEERLDVLTQKQKLTSEEKKELTLINNTLNFNCGEYLNNNFKGFGNKYHGYSLISNDKFVKLISTKKF